MNKIMDWIENANAYIETYPEPFIVFVVMFWTYVLLIT